MDPDTFLRYYILDGKTAVKTDVVTWARWCESHDRQVARDVIGPYRVSTVFLGVDHSFTTDGPPLIFETMVFKDSRSIYMDRGTTWDEAEAMHARAVALVKSGAIESE